MTNTTRKFMLIISVLCLGISACEGDDGTVGVAGPQGPAGPQGDPGPSGPQGPAGPAGETPFNDFVAETFNAAPNSEPRTVNGLNFSFSNNAGAYNDLLEP